MGSKFLGMLFRYHFFYRKLIIESENMPRENNLLLFGEYKRLVSCFNVIIHSRFLGDGCNINIENDAENERTSVIVKYRYSRKNFTFNLQHINLMPKSCHSLIVNQHGELQLTLQNQSTDTCSSTLVSSSSNNIPFSTNDIIHNIKENQDKCHCHSCGQKIFKNSCYFKRVLELPSDNWSDFSEMWFCHKHDDNSDGKPTGSRVDRKDDCYVGQTYVIIDRNKLHHTAVKQTTNNSFICTRCRALIGKVYDGKMFVKLLNNYTEEANTQACLVQIDLTSVVFQNPLLKEFNENCKLSNSNFTTEEYLKSLLLTISKQQTCFRFMLSSNEDEKLSCLVWLLDASAEIFLATCLPDSAVIVSANKYMKVLYRCRLMSKIEDPIFDMWESDDSVHHIKLDDKHLMNSVSALVSSTKLLPKSVRTANGFYVGLLALNS